MTNAALSAPPSSAESAARKPSSLLLGAALTIATWFISRTVIGVAWGAARNPFSLVTSLWTRFDSANYLRIARIGRTFGKCGSKGLPGDRLTFLYHHTWCGTAQWLPGYPLAVRTVRTVAAISLPTAGVLISWVALAAGIFLVWFGWGRDLPPLKALLLLLTFALFPGAIYSFAVFPISLAVTLLVGAALGVARGHPGVAAGLSALAGLCYPSAWYATIGLAVASLVVTWPHGASRAVRQSLITAAGLVSIVILAVWDQAKLGHFDAFFVMVSQHGERAPGFPGEAFVKFVVTHQELGQSHIGTFASVVLVVQALLAVALLVAGFVMTILRQRRGGLVPADWYPTLLGIGVVVPLILVSTAGDWNRSVALASPCVVLLRTTKTWVIAAVGGVAGFTAITLAHAFFANTLV